MKKIIAEYDTFKLIEATKNYYYIEGLEYIDTQGTKEELIKGLAERPDKVDQYFLSVLKRLP